MNDETNDEDLDNFDDLFSDIADEGDDIGVADAVAVTVGVKDLEKLQKEFKEVRCPIFISDLYHVFYYKGKFYRVGFMFG